MWTAESSSHHPTLILNEKQIEWNNTEASIMFVVGEWLKF